MRRTEVRITLYLYLPELLICVKGITEFVFYFVFSFTVKGSKTGLKKERRPIANRQLLYQSSLLPYFLPHGATVTDKKIISQENLTLTGTKQTTIYFLTKPLLIFIIHCDVLSIHTIDYQGFPSICPVVLSAEKVIFVGFEGFYEGQWLRARLCCRKISDSIFWLYYFTPR